MLKKLLVTALGMSLVAVLAACTNGHKLNVRKTLKGGKNSKVSVKDKELNAVIASDTVCIPLYRFVEQLMKKNNPYTLYVQSRTLSNASESLMKDTKFNSALLIDSLPELSDTKYGSEIMSSRLFARFFNVSDDSDCNQVKFLNEDGSIRETFNVELGIKPATVTDRKGRQAQTQQQGSTGLLTLTPRLSMITKVSKIEYRALDNDTLTIDVYERLGGDVQACNGATPQVGTRTRYVMNLSGDDKSLALGPMFAELLFDSLKTVPSSLEKTVTAMRETRKKAAESAGDKRTGSKLSTAEKEGMVNGAVKITYQELEGLDGSIKAKQFKELSCKKL